MEETAIVKQEQAVTFPTYFAATNSEQMARAQGGLTVWCESRAAQAKMDRLELERAVENARNHKWAVKTLERQLSKALKLEVYYEKVLAALTAGFVLVPAFPIDVFAIRTLREKPKPNVNVTTAEYRSNDSIQSEMPVAGEGEYVAAEAARVSTYDHNVVKLDPITKKITEEKNYYRFENEEFQDITFPMIACKPEVMNAAAQAMALKIFDEIGISTKSSGTNSRAFRRGDPLIIGTILGPGPRWSHKQANFLISWHVNVADI